MYLLPPIFKNIVVISWMLWNISAVSMEQYWPLSASLCSCEPFFSRLVWTKTVSGNMYEVGNFVYGIATNSNDRGNDFGNVLHVHDWTTTRKWTVFAIETTECMYYMSWTNSVIRWSAVHSLPSLQLATAYGSHLFAWHTSMFARSLKVGRDETRPLLIRDETGPILIRPATVSRVTRGKLSRKGVKRLSWTGLDTLLNKLV